MKTLIFLASSLFLLTSCCYIKSNENTLDKALKAGERLEWSYGKTLDEAFKNKKCK